MNSTELIQKARTIHCERFGIEPTWAAVAPGRVNLIGDHTDYTGGFAMPFAVDRFTVALASPGPSGQHAIYATSVAEQIDIDTDRVAEPAPSGSWHDYVRGVVALMRQTGVSHAGLCITLHGNVPIGRGLSSSASLELALATLLEAASGLAIDPIEKVRVCQSAENLYTGMPCGILDQYSVCMAQDAKLMMLDCRDVSSVSVDIRTDDVGVLVADSGVRHELTDGQYAARRQECHAAEEMLGAYLRDADATALQAIDDETVFLRARHVVTENRRVLAMREALSQDRYEEAGRLMNESHASLRDDFQSSCVEVDALVDVCNSTSGIFGARMTGGGFGGSVVALVRRDQAETASVAIQRGYWSATGLTTEPASVSPVAGAMQVHIDA